MKIQTLGIIFIIIILPISFALTLYTKSQLETLSLQRLYDTKLQQSTHDALQAFQINTDNNTESNLADSKLKDIEASVNTFFNSLSSNFELRGYSIDELKEYVPAMVYTMYDGYYIYSPYSNVATTTDTGVVINANETSNIEYGLKPYIYYSCRYKKSSDDFIITYSLDNYITIKGIIGGKYVNDAGYIISNIEPYGDGSYKYNGIAIDPEEPLKEYVGNTQYKYIKISGTKYYWDEARNRIFYILNGNIHEQISMKTNEELYNKYVTLITNNSSALRYYKEAYEFTNRALNTYNLKNLEMKDACDAEGNKIEFADKSYKKIFKEDDVKDKMPLEYATSNFNKHRKDVIRYTIETNLSIAITNFNRYSKNTTYDYQMPKLKETDWSMLTNNVSIISFLQGIHIGGKVYNGHAVVLNTETEELVREQDIYLIGADGHYHRTEDKYFLTYKTLGEYTEKTSYSKGVLDLDFRMRWANGSDGNRVYYYPKRELSCYDCVVNQSGINYDFEYSSIYEYLNKISTNTQTTLLRKTYYTALGRERWGSKLNIQNIENLDNITIDENYENNEISIDFNPNTYTNQPVEISVKFANSINLDKVVIVVANPPELSTVEYQALINFENGNFTTINNNPMKYTVTENSIIYVVAYSKSGKKVIKYDIVDWIDKEPPVIESVKIEEIDSSGKIVKTYNSIDEWNKKGYQWTKNTVRQTIKATDTGSTISGIDRIEYTYDNGGTIQSLPKANGGTWVIDDQVFDHNIRIRAVDVSANASEWTTPYRVSIDKVPPGKTKVELRYNNANGSYYKSGDLTNQNIWQHASATENHSGIARYEYSNDNGNTVRNFDNDWIIKESIYKTFWVRAIDNAGNVGQWSEPYTLNIDKIPPGTPTVTLRYNNENGTEYPSGHLTNQNVWQKANAEDKNGISGYEYSHDKITIGEFPSNPWTISWSLNKKFYVRAIDNAGNRGEWSEPYVINIDKDPPSKASVTLKYNDASGGTYPSGTLTNQNVWQQASATDANGIIGYEYTHDGVSIGNFPSNPWIISWSLYKNFYVRAVDGAGNRGEWSNVYTLQIDKDPPAVGNLTCPSGNNPNVQLILQNIPNPSDIARIDIRYRLDGSSAETNITINNPGITSNSYQYTITGGYSTKYENIYMIVYDRAGNSARTTENINVLTMMAPVQTLSAVANGRAINLYLWIPNWTQITNVTIAYYSP
ncbi:MAG: hypothetical protein HFJ48_04560, partial [Clostridia bacterium]|nr:hypothetical protein [Clostridia bacterium]